MTPPKPTRKVRRSKTRKVGWGVKGLFGLKKLIPNFEADARLEAQGQFDESDISEEEVGVIDVLHSRTMDGHDSWTVNADLEGMLQGSLWDAQQEPRLHIVDLRSDDQKLNDKKNGLEPSAQVQIRCLRSDIHISEIKFKNSEAEAKRQARKGKIERQVAAEAFFKSVVLEQGLVVGDMSDIFSELVIASLVVPIEDKAVLQNE